MTTFSFITAAKKPPVGGIFALAGQALFQKGDPKQSAYKTDHRQYTEHTDSSFIPLKNLLYIFLCSCYYYFTKYCAIFNYYTAAKYNNLAKSAK